MPLRNLIYGSLVKLFVFFAFLHCRIKGFTLKYARDKMDKMYQ